MMLSWIELDPAVLVFVAVAVVVAVEFVAVDFAAAVAVAAVFVSWRPIDPAIFFLSVSALPVSSPREEEESSCGSRRSLSWDRLLLLICFALFLLLRLHAMLLDVMFVIEMLE